MFRGKEEVSAVVGDFFGLKTCAALFSAPDPQEFTLPTSDTSHWELFFYIRYIILESYCILLLNLYSQAALRLFSSLLIGKLGSRSAHSQHDCILLGVHVLCVCCPGSFDFIPELAPMCSHSCGQAPSVCVRTTLDAGRNRPALVVLKRAIYIYIYIIECTLCARSFSETLQ